jgi:AraC-like DNA-binding protein
MRRSDFLPWPGETARTPDEGEPYFFQAGSNICLDFHGDPLRAKLAVFSDGNHHMALADCVARFLAINPEVGDVFYVTTPPGPLVAMVDKGVLHIGNLTLSKSPDVFIGPADVLDRLLPSQTMTSHRAFAESRGNVLLVRRGNPKNVQGVADLLRDDVRVTLSNPESEKASFQVYLETLLALAAEAGLEPGALKRRLLDKTGGTVFSTAIHHREIPQLLAHDRADVAPVYYHLALRYSRIFPEIFAFVPLGGTIVEPRPSAAHRITRYHQGLIGDGGAWGADFAAFMLGDEAGSIYEGHGLRHLA